MHAALRATSLISIIAIVILANAQTGDDTRKVQGRLLAQLAEAPIATNVLAKDPLTQLAESKAIYAPQSKPDLLSTHHKWLFIGLGSLCGILISVLVAQWVSEVTAWRRQKRKLAQDEACRHHVEQYTTDIESPTKPAQLSIFKESEPNQPVPSSAAEYSENNFSNPAAAAAASHSQPSPTGSSTTGIRLPPSILLRRAPSLRSNLVSVAIRRSSSSREGTPRSPLGRCKGGLGPAKIRRTNSSKSRSSSLCGTPRSIESKELTVDSSVKAQDVRAIGWAPHNHGHRSPATSGHGTPTASGSPNESYTLSPGRLEYRIGHPKYDGGNYSEEENTSNDGIVTTNNRNKQNLYRMATDAGLADFRLTTSVAEDEIEETSQEITPDPGPYEEEESPSMLSSSTGNTTYPPTSLFTAKSIKPKDVMDANNEVDTEETQSSANNQVVASIPSPKNSSNMSSPRTLVLTGANVAILSSEEFTAQVQLLRVLGAGAAGCVHQGLWKGMPVAVKILHPSRQTSASAVEAFRKEVEVMARIGPHPGVIAVFATCLTPPNLAIIVELAERGSLHSILHEEGFRPRYGTLLALAEDIACALAHCHSLKLVHRDLKAHNVLLDTSGRAKVADFGLAAAKNRTFLTVEQGALGTAASMAPEQFAAHEVSERCDSYAFGCLLWELITGRQPWEECTNIMQIVMAVGCERRRPPIPQGCPPQLGRLIRECWRHNPALRPGFSEIIDRIREMKREDGAAEALGAASLAAAAVFYAEQQGKKNRSFAEYILPFASNQERVSSKTGAAHLGKPSPGLSRLAISSS